MRTLLSYLVGGVLAASLILTPNHNAYAASISISCSNSAVRDALNHVVGWDIHVSVSASPNTERYNVDGGGSASSLHQSNVTGNKSFTIRVNGPNLSAYGVTARFVVVSGGDSCNNSGANGGGNPPPSIVPPPPTSQCPDPNTVPVAVTPATIAVGDIATALAPNGWNGGRFMSSDTGVADIQNQTGGQTASISGISTGSAIISGSGWTASNGATGCNLGPNIVTVTDQVYTGTISADPTNICAPQTSGSTIIHAQTNTFANVAVYNAVGLADGSIVFSIPANTPTNTPTGNWVKDGTIFKLIAPFNNNQSIAQTGVTITSNCTNPPPPTGAVTCTPQQPTALINRNITFTATTSNLSTQNQLFTWQATGGSPSAGQGQTFTTAYATAGTKTVTVSVAGASGTCTVSVSEPQPPLPPPWAAIYNTQTVPAEYGSVTCGKLLAVWRNVSLPGTIEGFRVYNSITGKYVELKNPNIDRYEFNPLDLGAQTLDSSQTYAVASFRGSLESSHTNAGIASPITNCGSDLSPSNKDIIKVGTTVLNYNPINQAADANFPNGTTVHDGDTISFALNIVNGGYEDYSGPVTIVDTMFNLFLPNDVVNARVLCNDECTLTRANYDSRNRQITFVVTPVAGNTIGHNEAWTVVFSAKTVPPLNDTGSIYRFQNRASVNNFTASWLQTPYIPVIKDSGVPNIYETR